MTTIDTAYSDLIYARLTDRECAIRGAAYMDTDGCIHVTNTFYVRCVYTCAYPQIALWLKAMYGGGIHEEQRVSPSRNVYRWTLSQCGYFLAEIEPFLILKREQALIAMECLQVRKVEGVDSKRLVQLRRKMHTLNKRGTS